ncbi:unnamed protein product [Cladocopium goreaui]|uniref:Uncharacterized protein n=1 Tax=Cladocopium goreaui TaxID=2562237 RepID=A0A9P1DD21_9DINO|nr:unnamed protein product [Cladocopium goreaui]
MGRKKVVKKEEGRRKKYLDKKVPAEGEERRKALNKIYDAARRERDKKKDNKKKEAEDGNADADGGQLGQLVPVAVAVGKHEKPLTVDMGVQCNIIDDASCHSCQKTEEKYLNEIYQLSSQLWDAKNALRRQLNLASRKNL